MSKQFRFVKVYVDLNWFISKEPTENGIQPIIRGILYMGAWEAMNLTIINGGIGESLAEFKIIVKPNKWLRSTFVIYYDDNTASIGPMQVDNFFETNFVINGLL